MKTNPSTSGRTGLRADNQAFTLIELITVMAIIGILMLLLFPAIGVVKDNMRKVQAKNDVMGIVSALKQYYTEYGKYPTVDTGETPDPNKDIVVGDTNMDAVADNSQLFNTLRAINEAPNLDHIYNPRRIVFYENKTVSKPTAPKSGFVDDVGGGTAKKGCLYDPWGIQYFIILDANYDNFIDLKGFYEDFETAGPGGKAPRTTVGAFSLGKDSTLGDKKTGQRKFRLSTSDTADDVVSWQ